MFHSWSSSGMCRRVPVQDLYRSTHAAMPDLNGCVQSSVELQMTGQRLKAMNGDRWRDVSYVVLTFLPQSTKAGLTFSTDLLTQAIVAAIHCNVEGILI